tara:strand:+ start:108 stop:1847 length:1740 start_codon:yes stop_codon:yes gene_type:complete
VAWQDSYEPEEATQYEDLKYWTKSNNKGYQHQSLDNSDDPKCPFQKLEIRKFDWDDDYTVELRDNAFASSGAFMAIPKVGHWVRLYVQANNNAAYFYQNLPEIGLANVPTSWGVFQKDDAEALNWQILAFGGTGSSALADGFLEIVLIGRSGANPTDILTVDVDQDWGWDQPQSGGKQKAFNLILDGQGGSDGSNMESECWITLLDYGTTGQLNTGATVPQKNSMGRDVNMQGLIPNVPNGYYWDFQAQEVKSIDDGTPQDWGNDGDSTVSDDEDAEDITTTDPPKPEDTKPTPAGDDTFKGMWNNFKAGDKAKTPFTVWQFSGGSGQRSWPNANVLRINNNDTPFVDSGAVLIEVREGYYVDFNVMNENRGYFTDIGNSLQLDSQLKGEDFAGGDSDFTIRLYGGNFIYADPDADFADAVASFGAFGISTETGSYSITEPADNDYEIKLLGFGIDERQPEEDDDDIIIDDDNGGGSTTPTDPFDLIDGTDTPFDETDGLTDRVVKSTVFGINNSFKAIEAAFEGFMIALPALIVIGSAVIVAKLAIGATEKGAAKVVSLAQGVEKSITTVSIPIEGAN